MAPTKTNTAKVLAGLPQWLTATTEHNESFRFEALTLLEQARSKLAEIEAKPPPDAAATAVAALHPLHLVVKALLAAKAMKSYSTRASLELLHLLYGEEIPESLIQQYVGVQSVRIQGAKSLEAAKSFIATATQLLAKTP